MNQLRRIEILYWVGWFCHKVPPKNVSFGSSHVHALKAIFRNEIIYQLRCGRTPSGIIGRWGVQAAYTWMGNQRPKGPKVMIQDIFTTKNRDLTSFLGAVPPISGGFLTIVGRCWEYIPHGRSNPSDSHDFHLWPARMPRYIHWCWLASVHSSSDAAWLASGSTKSAAKFHMLICGKMMQHEPKKHI